MASIYNLYIYILLNTYFINRVSMQFLLLIVEHKIATDTDNPITIL